MQRRIGLMAMIGAALWNNNPIFAVALYLSFTAYLRLPSDLTAMIGSSLVV